MSMSKKRRMVNSAQCGKTVQTGGILTESEELAGSSHSELSLPQTIFSEMDELRACNDLLGYET